MAGGQHKLTGNVPQELLHPLLVVCCIRAGDREMRQLFMKGGAEEFPADKEFVVGPGSVSLIAMLEEIRLVAELNAYQLVPQSLGNTGALGERLFDRAAAQVETVDAAPSGSLKKLLKIVDGERRDGVCARFAAARIRTCLLYTSRCV